MAKFVGRGLVLALVVFAQVFFAALALTAPSAAQEAATAAEPASVSASSEGATAGAGFSAAVTTAPAATQAAPATETPVAASRPVTPSTESAAPGLGDYVLGAGDKVRLIVFGEEDLSGEFVVDSSGKVALPLVGQVTAAGHSLRAFEAAVSQKLREESILNDPKVAAEVLNFRPFYILGEVTKPGEYPYTANLNIFNAVATAGGFTPLANRTRVFIKRINVPEEREFSLLQPVQVQPGDTIRVVKGSFFILGEITQAGEYAYSDGMSVQAAIATAGGFTYRANQRRVFIKHEGQDVETAYRLAPSLTLRPGDTVRVPERFF